MFKKKGISISQVANPSSLQDHQVVLEGESPPNGDPPPSGDQDQEDEQVSESESLETVLNCEKRLICWRQPPPMPPK